jgi:hypothetical protein
MDKHRSRLPLMMRTDAHVVDERARRVFGNAIPPEWVTRATQSDDYGIDFQVEVFEAYQPLALRTAFQVKGASRVSADAGSIRFALNTRNLATYVDAEVLPVFLVVCDVERGAAYFVFLQKFALEELAGRNWRAQETVTISVPAANRLQDRVLLLRALRDAHAYMANLRPGSVIASLEAQRRRLESRDPRFRVSIAVIDQQHFVELRALEPVSLSMHLSDVSPEKVFAFEVGETVDFAPGEIAIEGTPLFAELTGTGGQISVGQDVRCQASLEFIDGARSTAELLNLAATVRLGIGGQCISVEAARELLRLSIAWHDSASLESSARVSLAWSLDSWLGRDIETLPHFNSLLRLSRLRPGRIRVNGTLHVPGANVPMPRLALAANRMGRALAPVLEAIDLGRDVARLLNARVALKRFPTADDLAELRKLRSLATDGEYEAPGDRAWITCTFAGDSFRPSLLSATPGDVTIRVQGHRDRFEVFGDELSHPVGQVLLTKAVGRVVRNEGRDGVRVEFRGTRGSRYVLRASAVASGS